MTNIPLLDNLPIFNADTAAEALPPSPSPLLMIAFHTKDTSGSKDTVDKISNQK
jgi:hypothetical protein